MTHAERYDLLETSILKLMRLRDELLSEAEHTYEGWDGVHVPPIIFRDGSKFQPS